ncbi:MAG: YaaR family protein [Treponema sp.]|nr:YaaR family protein [Treponema sp.]
MAKVDGTDTSFFMNPAAYSQVKPDKSDDKKNKGINRSEKTSFSNLFDSLKGKTADELGPLQNLPVSDDTVDALMDDVRDAGDVLKNRPLPEEIMRYKQAVRNFINYVIKNTYSLEHEEGTPKFLTPGFKGQRGTPEAMSKKRHTVIQVIDKKLEDLAAMLLSSQKHQLELVSRLEEIRGLLIDLLQ